MNEYLILHQMLFKMQIAYPVLAGIITFSIFETIVEWKIRKEKRNEQY